MTVNGSERDCERCRFHDYLGKNQAGYALYGCKLQEGCCKNTAAEKSCTGTTDSKTI